MSGRLIVLNGASSSGKSSIAKELQEQLGAEWLHFEMDAFWDMASSEEIANSVHFPQMKTAIIQSVRAFLDTGHALIVDIVCFSDQMQEFYDVVEGYHPYCVAVRADADVLRAREIARGDRDIGLADGQYKKIIGDFSYDLVVDTGEVEADEAARRIIGGRHLLKV